MTNINEKRLSLITETIDAMAGDQDYNAWFHEAGMSDEDIKSMYQNMEDFAIACVNKNLKDKAFSDEEWSRVINNLHLQGSWLD